MRVSLEQKFNLLENPWKDLEGAIETFENPCVPDPSEDRVFDNSNMGPVRFAMVVFVNGKAKQKDYREYKIKTVARTRQIMPACGSHSQTLQLVDGLTPPDLDRYRWGQPGQYR